MTGKKLPGKRATSIDAIDAALHVAGHRSEFERDTYQQAAQKLTNLTGRIFGPGMARKILLKAGVEPKRIAVRTGPDGRAMTGKRAARRGTEYMAKALLHYVKVIESIAEGLGVQIEGAEGHKANLKFLARQRNPEAKAAPIHSDNGQSSQES